MASFTKTASLSFTFFLLHIISPLQLHARELTSFSKALQNEYPSDTVTQTPVTASGRKQPEKLPPIGKYGYGLYGHRYPDEYFPTSRPPRTEFGAESYDSRELNPAYERYGEKRKNDEQLDAMRRNHYGVSDTRAMENGKYFYNLNSQRHGDVYDPAMRGSQGYGVKDGSLGYGVYNYEGKGKDYVENQAIEGHQNYQNQEEYYEP